jgi:thiamine transport system substrate-binding protein
MLSLNILRSISTLHTIVLLIVALSIILMSNAIAQEPTRLTLVTHDSFSLSEEAIALFEAEYNVELEILRAGDAGQVVNQSILSKSNPLGDILYGVDNTFLDRALQAEILLPYTSTHIVHVPEAFRIDETMSVTPINYGDVCLNYDVAFFESNDLPVPETFEDLADEAYANLLVAMNPATSSPGLAFLLTTVEYFGEEGDYTYLDYWTDLINNGTLITDGWSDAYFGQFTAGSEDGTYPMVVSYASSPPFTVDEATNIASTQSLIADGMCFRQIEFAGILAGTENEELAQAFIDFMLSVPVQESLPLQMFVFPVHEDAELPDLFAEHAQIPDNPVVMPPERIEANRDAWISTWLETVTR